jgi:hypothetical protein
MLGELDMNNQLLTDPLLTGGEIRNSPIRGTDGGTANEIIVPTAAGVPTLGGDKIFHAGNDGAGSGLDADTLDGVEGVGYIKPADDPVTVTGVWAFDGDVTESGFGTGAKIKDGKDALAPIGFNVMSLQVQNTSYTLALDRNGMLLHRVDTIAVDYTLPNDSTLPVGATWLVNNTGASGLFRIKGATGVSVLNLAGAFGIVTTVVAGNGFTLDVGAVVTIYKVADTTYHIWGGGLTTSA